jgi:hypothetical protein
MYAYLAFVFALLALCCFYLRFSHIQESTMNAILSNQWHWIVRHTWIQTDSGKILINERIDAAYVTFQSEAVDYAMQRHAVKPNMVLTAYPCRNAAERYDARMIHAVVSKRLLDFENEMTQLEQRMH